MIITVSIVSVLFLFCYNQNMASNVDYLKYVLELLNKVSGISYKKMMGEFMLYKDGLIFGGVYDNRFLIKKTASNEHYHFKEVIPYPNAKPMLMVDIEDDDEIKEIIMNVCRDLKEK